MQTQLSQIITKAFTWNDQNGSCQSLGHTHQTPLGSPHNPWLLMSLMMQETLVSIAKWTARAKSLAQGSRQSYHRNPLSFPTSFTSSQQKNDLLFLSYSSLRVAKHSQRLPRKWQNLHPWRYSKPTGDDPGQPALDVPVLADGQSRWTQDAPSVILWQSQGKIDCSSNYTCSCGHTPEKPEVAYGGTNLPITACGSWGRRRQGQRLRNYRY